LLRQSANSQAQEKRKEEEEEKRKGKEEELDQSGFHSIGNTAKVVGKS